MEYRDGLFKLLTELTTSRAQRKVSNLLIEATGSSTDSSTAKLQDKLQEGTLFFIALASESSQSLSASPASGSSLKIGIEFLYGCTFFLLSTFIAVYKIDNRI